MLQFDMSNATPWDPLQTFHLAEGPYKVEVVDVDDKYNGGKSTQFTLLVLEGPTPGQTKHYIGNEPGEKGGNRDKWFQALLCIAPDPEKLRANVKANPNVQFDPVAMFKGKTMCLRVVANPGTNKDPQTGQERPNLPDKDFITPAQYAQLVAAAKSGTTATRPNGTTPAAAATPPAAAPASDPVKSLFG